MARNILLFDIIDSFSAKETVKQLFDLNRDNHDEITLVINSRGGEVQSMFSIIDAMNVVESPIRTLVMGQASSAGAVIAAAGNKRLMTETSRIMIHELSGVYFGTLTNVKEAIQQGEKEHLKALKILSKASGKSTDDLQKLIKKTDKFLDAKAAKKLGLVQEIVKSDSASVIKLSESINGESFEVAVDEEGHSRVQLLLEGEYEHSSYGSFKIDEDKLNKFKENFDNNVRGIELSIDYTHENEAGENPAACWMKSLSVEKTDKGMALFASVEFTPKGRKLITEKEYKYASADFAINYMTDKGECVPYVLCGGTLTNRPFIKEMNPIKLSERKPKEKIKMELKTLCEMLKAEHNVDVDGLTGSNEKLTAEIETLSTKIKELSALPAEKDTEIETLKANIQELNSSISDSEKEAVFETLMAEGKVVPAQKEAVLGLFENGKEMSAFYKDAQAVVNLKKDGSENTGEDSLTAAEEKLVANKTYTREEILKTRTIHSNN